LSLSREFLTKHEKLLLDAVEAYESTIERKWSRAILEDPALSILPDLNSYFKNGGTIR
jgi:hypothetical protein